MHNEKSNFNRSLIIGILTYVISMVSYTFCFASIILAGEFCGIHLIAIIICSASIAFSMVSLFGNKQ